mmetsp:Transcript_102456/g.187140  ORF Transcript_102456/g.187140 Transcript_102456/m.187140 type:complete len:82 (+) Transcript_102456:530-775(+)
MNSEANGGGEGRTCSSSNGDDDGRHCGGEGMHRAFADFLALLMPRDLLLLREPAKFGMSSNCCAIAALCACNVNIRIWASP